MSLKFLFLETIFLMFLFFSTGKKDCKQITSSYKQKIKIDGILDEWGNEESVVLNGMKSKSENRVRIRSYWDMEMLYFSFDVKDKDLRAYQDSTDHPRLFLDDMVEILFDTDNDKDSCWGTADIVYHINLLGAKKDDRGTADCQSDPTWNGCAIYKIKMHGTLNDTTDIDWGYSVEIGVPWIEIGRVPKSGLIIGINFANGDNDGMGRQLFDWAGAWPMRSPYAFGDLILNKEN